MVDAYSEGHNKIVKVYSEYLDMRSAEGITQDEVTPMLFVLLIRRENHVL
jgi:hypothetical protein